MRKAYEEFYKQAVADAKENIRYCIHVAGSSSDLDTAVKERIKDLWVELVNDIESEVDRLCKRAKVADDEFLFSLFRNLYTARRRYWWRRVGDFRFTSRRRRQACILNVN